MKNAKRLGPVFFAVAYLLGLCSPAYLEGGESAELSVEDTVDSSPLQSLVGRLSAQWKIGAETENYVTLISDAFKYGTSQSVCGRLRLVISLGEAADPAKNLFPLTKDELFAFKPLGVDGCRDVRIDEYFDVEFEPAARGQSLELLVEVLEMIRAAADAASDIEFTSDQVKVCVLDHAEAMKVAEATSRDVDEGLEVTVGLRGCSQLPSSRWVFVSTVAQFEASDESLRLVVWHAPAQTH